MYIGDCPVGAIEVEHRESEPYDEVKVMDNVVAKGEATIKANLKHLNDHGQDEYLTVAKEYLTSKGMDCGCPG